jgi:hypothetical protein
MRPVWPGEEGVLIFVHVPKTAGSTLRRILRRQYGDRVFTVHGTTPAQSMEQFRLLAQDRRDRVRVFQGHMAFGLHEVLPTSATYVTFLRDPVERIVSHYLYVRRTPSAPLHRDVVSEGLSLEDYVRRSRMAPLVNNGQTRLLGGSVMEDSRPATEAMLLAAKRNLARHFLLAGLTDRFDETVILLRRALGWHWPVYRRAKVAPDRPSRAALPATAVRAIEDRNELDRELYRFAGERFDAIAGSESPAFRRDLIVFKALNQAYSAVRRARRLRPLPHSRWNGQCVLGGSMVRSTRDADVGGDEA